MDVQVLLQVLWPVLSQVILLVLAVLVSVGVIAVLNALKNNQDAAALLQHWDWLIKAAEDIVVRVAFHVTADELVQYTEEAELTGRDIRLVIAYRELMQLSSEHGYDLDLSQAIGLVEKIVQDYKNGLDSPISAAPSLDELQAEAR